MREPIKRLLVFEVDDSAGRKRDEATLIQRLFINLYIRRCQWFSVVMPSFVRLQETGDGLIQPHYGWPEHSQTKKENGK